MAKLMIYVFVALVAATLIMADCNESKESSEENPNCVHRGAHCEKHKDCCGKLKCDQMFSKRCHDPITLDEILRLKEKLGKPQDN